MKRLSISLVLFTALLPSASVVSCSSEPDRPAVSGAGGGAVDPIACEGPADCSNGRCVPSHPDELGMAAERLCAVECPEEAIGDFCGSPCGASYSDCLPGWYCASINGAPPGCQCTVMPEACNGKDDDCNGILDDPASADEGCSHLGPGLGCEVGSCVPCTARCGGQCVDVSADPQSCGACGVVCPDAGPDAIPSCAGGTCGAVQILASEETAIVDIAADGVNVYWIVKNGKSGRVRRCAALGCGSAPDDLAIDQPDPLGIAVDGAHVSWTNRGDGTIRWCPSGGCGEGGPTVVQTGTPAPERIVVAGGALYWTHHDEASGWGISTCSIASCESSITEFAPCIGNPKSLVAGEGHLYWIDIEGVPNRGTVKTCPLAGCGAQGPTVLSPMQKDVLGLAAIGGGALWWARSNDETRWMTHELFQCGATGCGMAPQTLAAMSASPLHTGSDGATLYSITGGAYSGAVQKCAASGCGQAPEVIASGFSEPGRLAVDAFHVYWIGRALGKDAKGQASVLRVPR